MRCKTFLLAAVAAVAVAGCGGDDSSNEALTYDGFAEAANGVCQAAESSVNEFSEQLTGNPRQDAGIYDDLIPALEDASNAFGDLEPPEELQEPYDDFVAATDAQLEGARDAQAAAEAGDTAEYQRILEDLQPYGDDADEAGSKLGAADCVG